MLHIELSQPPQTVREIRGRRNKLEKTSSKMLTVFKETDIRLKNAKDEAIIAM